MKPTKAHLRFWDAMVKLFPGRWENLNGNMPNPDWCAMLDRYTVALQRAVVEHIRNEILQGTRKYAPTCTETESVFYKVARSTSDTTDYVRGYWRQSIIAEIERAGAAVNLWPYGTALQNVPKTYRETILMRARALLDELDAMEKHTGKRTDDMHRKLAHDVQTLLKPFRSFGLQSTSDVPRETRSEG